MRVLPTLLFALFFTATLFAVNLFAAGVNEPPTEKTPSEGFAASHDEAIYGKALTVRKVEDSLNTTDLALHGDRLFAVGNGHLTVYDVSDPQNPRETATLLGLGESRQVVWYKKHLYLTSRMGGLYVIDVSQPDLPRLRSHYDTMELATGICCGVDSATGRDMAFVSQRQFGTEFIDISDPSHPTHIGYVVSGEAQSVDFQNGILYAGDWGVKKLTVIDARNLQHAEIIGQGSLTGLGDGVFVRGNYAFLSTGPSDRKLNPVPGYGLEVFSIKDPRNPQRVARVDFPPQAKLKFPDSWVVSVDDAGMAYATSSYSGFFCVDVKDPTKPQIVAHAVLPVLEMTGDPDPVMEVLPGEGVLYVAGAQGGLYVAEAPEIAHPIPRKRKAPTLEDPPLPDVDSLAEVRKDFAVLPTVGQAMAAAPWKDGLVWVAAGTDGFLLVDVSDVQNGGQPAIKKVFPIPTFAYDIKISGNRAYTAEGDAGVGIYDLKPNGEFRPLGRFVQDFPVRQVVLADPKKWLAAKCGNARVVFLDISDPFCPKRAFVYNNFGILYGRDLVETPTKSKILLCVAQINGLLWFDFSGEVPELKKVSFPDRKVSFANSACFHDGKLFFFASGGFRLINECEEREIEDVPLTKIPGLPHAGKAVSNGQEIVYTDRSRGEILTLDVSDLQNPKITRSWKLHAHPELPVFVNGKMVIPCGHGGLLIEK